MKKVTWHYEDLKRDIRYIGIDHKTGNTVERYARVEGLHKISMGLKGVIQNRPDKISVGIYDELGDMFPEGDSIDVYLHKATEKENTGQLKKTGDWCFVGGPRNSMDSEKIFRESGKYEDLFS